MSGTGRSRAERADQEPERARARAGMREVLGLRVHRRRHVPLFYHSALIRTLARPARRGRRHRVWEARPSAAIVVPVPFLYTLTRPFLGPMFTAYWRPRITGIENIPRTGAFLVASNHLANVDSFLIPVVSPRMVRFVSKDVFWKTGGLKGRIQKWFMNSVGTVPLDREALSSGRGALDAALDVLKAGEGFGIYPEGSRSRDGLLHKGQPGAAWLALESGAPVIPLGLAGTQNLFLKGRKMPTRYRPDMRFGAPIDLSDLPTDLSAGARRRLATDRIMTEIQRLSGQEWAPGAQPRGAGTGASA
ncbi:lysophospholipid acyltransferase family protein [Brachybacterium sp. NPDC056505]|uniref:lysophospholipid acyltransferase family protein n=1 Tax=Brachybacterium sp. NPDC056505 TaxID=3345843 RepID=UPI00366F0FB0